MSSELPAPAAVTYPIAYEQFAGSTYNLDLRGRGTLTIRPAGPEYVFAGKARGFRLFSAPTEAVFSAAQIRNVVVEGPRVQFTTDLGKSGAQGRPFVFFAASAEQAAAIAAALPRGEDTDFVESRAFARQLAQLTEAGGPWTSPTNLIIAANILIFIAMGLAGAGWFEVGDLTLYLRYGANNGDATADGEWWRLVTSQFLHFGVVHLLLNMWALLQVGHLVERIFGRSLYTLVYLGAGIAGSVASLLWHRDMPIASAGASGAIFGIYGVLLGYMLREKNALPRSVFQPLLQSTLFFAGYNLVFGLVKSGIDNSAHVGGFAGGFILGWALALPLDRPTRARLVPRKAALGLAIVAAIGGLGVALAPHFPYRLVDEFAWDRVNRDPAAQEQAIVTAESRILTQYQQTGDSAALIPWLDAEALPFYRRWSADLSALALTPERLTARRQAALAEILRLRIESFEHLRDAARRGDRRALEVFSQDSARVQAAIARFAALGK